MRWETLDHLDSRYTINDLGEVHKDGKPVKQYVTSHGSLAFKVNRLSVFIAKTVAEFFIPNPNNYNFVGYIDGNKRNCRADNLYWKSHNQNKVSVMQAKVKVNKKESKILRRAIQNALDSEDWATAQKLGEIMTKRETLNIRPMPEQYPILPQQEKQDGTSLILRVYTLADGTIDYCSTKEVTQKYGILPSTVVKRYSNPPDELEPDVIYLERVASVFKYCINAKIDVFKDGKVIDTNSYTETCVKYDIHFEDLNELLYTSDIDHIYYKGLEFRINRKTKEK